MSQRSVAQLIRIYSAAAREIRPRPVPRIAPDPDDDVVIGTAVAAKADYIVTGDRGLLSVVKFEGGVIVTVHEALRAILLS